MSEDVAAGKRSVSGLLLELVTEHTGPNKKPGSGWLLELVTERMGPNEKPGSGLLLELVSEDVALPNEANAILDQRSECLLMCLEKSVQ